MTAKKQFSVFLLLAAGASAAQGQTTQPSGALTLELQGVSVVESVIEEGSSEQSVEPPASNVTENIPQRLELSSLPNHSASQPSKIPRSILESPRVQATPVSTPSSEGRRIPKMTLATHGTELDEPEDTTVAGGELSTAEMIRQRFPNGKPQIERWVAEDAKGNIVNHGTYTEYDMGGNVVAAGNYAYGQREGTWSKQITVEQTQSLTGPIDKGFSTPLTSKATFKAGKLDGEWTISDAKGNLLLVWTYADGQRHGPSTLFSSKGEITQSLSYKNNMADGPAHFEENGKGRTDTTFSDGMMVQQVDKWFPAVAGKPRVLQVQEWHLVASPLNVARSDWNTNSVVYQSAAVTEPIRHGMAVTFYPNGQRESEGSYDHGSRTGTFAWWYANGQQKTVGEYRNDREHSEWAWWHENGMKQANGMFADGRKVDEWSLWSAEGKLVKRTQAPVEQQSEERQVAGRETDTPVQNY